jgi:hypothetical protein
MSIDPKVNSTSSCRSNVVFSVLSPQMNTHEQVYASWREDMLKAFRQCGNFLDDDSEDMESGGG